MPGCPSSGPGAELQTRTHWNASKLGLSKITGAPPRHCWGPKIQMEKERSCCPASAPGTVSPQAGLCQPPCTNKSKEHSSLIHPRKKESLRRKHLSEGGRGCWEISSIHHFPFLPFRVLWWIKPLPRLMGWVRAPQFFQLLSAAFENHSRAQVGVNFKEKILISFDFVMYQ